MNHALTAIITAALLLVAAFSPAMAANECRVEYGWTTSAGQNRSQTVDIDAGQYLMGISRSGLRYVKNIGLNDVVPTLSGPLIHNNTPQLGNGQSDPPTWPAAGYVGDTMLIQLQCLATSSAPASIFVEFYKAANRSAAEIAQLAKQTFALADAQVAVLLRDAGFSAAQVLAALHTGLNTSADALAEIAESHLGQTLSATAGILKNLGISPTTVATALLRGYTATEAAVVAGMTQAGFTLAQVAGAVQAAFNAGSEKVIEAFVRAWGELHNEACGANGCPAAWNQRLEELRVALGMPVQDFGNQLARVLRQTFAGFTPEAIAEFLRSAWDFTREQARVALEFAGWLAAQVETALNTVYGMAEQAVAQQQQLDSVYYSQRPYGAPRSEFHSCGSHWGHVSVNRNETVFIPADDGGFNWTLDFRGNAALALTTHIQGLPRGTRYEITGRDECSITIWLQPPSSGVGVGVAHLMIGNTQGASFLWEIGPVPSQFFGGPTDYAVGSAKSMGGSSPPPNVQLGVPQPIAPLDGATCVATTPLAFGTGNAVVKLSWHADPAATRATGTYRVEYEVQVRNIKNNYSCPGFPEQLHDPNSCIYFLTLADSHDVTLPANTHFAWRVRSVLRESGGWPSRPSAQEGAWSQEQGFLSAPVAVDPPVLLLPVNNFLVSTTRDFSPPPVTLEWRDANNSCSEAHFEVELSRRRNDEPGAPFAVYETIRPSSKQTSVTINLSSTYRYQWRVRRLDSDAWSETRTIRTSTL